MKNCWYCGKEVGIGDYAEFHAKCLTEWHRRDDNNLCVRCGTKYAGPGDDYCDTCTDGSEYIGYHGR